jgi:hypothetical protein
MKKLILILMMGLMVLPSFAHGGKGKKRHHKKHNTEVVSEVVPIKRQRWVEKEGNYYVIVQRTTISREDYLRIRALQRANN